MINLSRETHYRLRGVYIKTISKSVISTYPEIIKKQLLSEAFKQGRLFFNVL